MTNIIKKICVIMFVLSFGIFVSCKKNTENDYDEILDGNYSVEPVNYSGGGEGMFDSAIITAGKNLENVVGLDENYTQSVMLYFDIDKEKYLVGDKYSKIDLLSKYMQNPSYDVSELELNFKLTRLGVSRGQLYDYDNLKSTSKDSLPLDDDKKEILISYSSSKVKDLLTNREYNININFLVNYQETNYTKTGYIIFIDKGYVKDFSGTSDTLYILQDQVYGQYEVVQENNKLYVLFDSYTYRILNDGNKYITDLDIKEFNGLYPIYNELVKLYSEKEYKVTKQTILIKRGINLDDLVAFTKTIPDLVKSKFVEASSDDIEIIKTQKNLLMVENNGVEKIIDAVKQDDNSLYHLNVTDKYFVITTFSQEKEKYYKYESLVNIDFSFGEGPYMVLKGVIDKNLITDEELNISFTLYTKLYNFKSNQIKEIYDIDEYSFEELAMVINDTFLTSKEKVVFFSNDSKDYLNYIKIESDDDSFSLIFKNPYYNDVDSTSFASRMKNIFGKYYDSFFNTSDGSSKIIPMNLKKYFYNCCDRLVEKEFYKKGEISLFNGYFKINSTDMLYLIK